MKHDIETFYLVDTPDGDRRYVQRNMTPKEYSRYKDDGARVFKVRVPIPEQEGTHDVVLGVSVTELKTQDSIVVQYHHSLCSCGDVATEGEWCEDCATSGHFLDKAKPICAQCDDRFSEEDKELCHPCALVGTSCDPRPVSAAEKASHEFSELLENDPLFQAFSEAVMREEPYPEGPVSDEKEQGGVEPKGTSCVALPEPTKDALAALEPKRLPAQDQLFTSSHKADSPEACVSTLPTDKVIKETSDVTDADLEQAPVLSDVGKEEATALLKGLEKRPIPCTKLHRCKCEECDKEADVTKKVESDPSLFVIEHSFTQCKKCNKEAEAGKALCRSCLVVNVFEDRHPLIVQIEKDVQTAKEKGTCAKCENTAIKQDGLCVHCLWRRRNMTCYL